MEFIKIENVEDFNKGLKTICDRPEDFLFYSDKGIATNIDTTSKYVYTIDRLINTFVDNNKIDKYNTSIWL